MLPLVGIIAIVLLVVAGKFFFFSGAEEGQTPLPRIEEPSRVSQGGKPAQAEEVVDRQKETPPLERRASAETPGEAPSSVVVSSVPVNKEERRPLGTGLDILAVPYDSKTPSPPSPPVTPQEVTVIVPKLPVQPKPPVVNVAPEKQPLPAAEPKPDPAAAKPSWMVQVGAFSTQAAASAVSQQVTKAGYKATVVAGKNLHRVLIQAGPTREDALALATRMSQPGFHGAFIVPPRQ
jgi:cell division protein FtsN